MSNCSQLSIFTRLRLIVFWGSTRESPHDIPRIQRRLSRVEYVRLRVTKKKRKSVCAFFSGCSNLSLSPTETKRHRNCAKVLKKKGKTRLWSWVLVVYRKNLSLSLSTAALDFHSNKHTFSHKWNSVSRRVWATSSSIDPSDHSIMIFHNLFLVPTIYSTRSSGRHFPHTRQTRWN